MQDTVEHILVINLLCLLNMLPCTSWIAVIWRLGNILWIANHWEIYWAMMLFWPNDVAAKPASDHCLWTLSLWKRHFSLWYAHNHSCAQHIHSLIRYYVKYFSLMTLCDHNIFISGWCWCGTSINWHIQVPESWEFGHLIIATSWAGC